MKIISKGHSFHNINPKTGQAHKGPKGGHITSDTFILNIVQQDLKLIFTGDILTNVPFEYKRSQLEHSVIDEEVCKLIRKKGNYNNICTGGRFLLKSFYWIQKRRIISYYLKFKKIKSRL